MTVTDANLITYRIADKDKLSLCIARCVSTGIWFQVHTEEGDGLFHSHPHKEYAWTLDIRENASRHLRDHIELILRPDPPLPVELSRLIAAMRGPDVYGHRPGDEFYDLIKNSITGRLRSIAFRDTAQAYPGAVERVPLTKQGLTSLCRYYTGLCLVPVGERNEHWLCHTENAVCYTRNDPIWGGLANQVIRLSSRSRISPQNTVFTLVDGNIAITLPHARPRTDTDEEPTDAADCPD